MSDKDEAIERLEKRSTRLHSRLDRIRDDVNDLNNDIAELKAKPDPVTMMPGLN